MFKFAISYSSSSEPSCGGVDGDVSKSGTRVILLTVLVNTQYVTSTFMFMICFKKATLFEIGIDVNSTNFECAHTKFRLELLSKAIVNLTAAL